MQHRHGLLGFYIGSLALLISLVGLFWFCAQLPATPKSNVLPPKPPAVLDSQLTSNSVFLADILKTDALLNGINSCRSEAVAGTDSQPLVSFQNDKLFEPGFHHGITLATYTTFVESPTWPKPKALIEQVESLRRIPAAADWASRTLESLESLSQSPIDSPDVEGYLIQLEVANRRLPQLANTVWNQKSATSLGDSSDLVRMNYRLARRLAIWKQTRQAILSGSDANDITQTSLASFGEISFDGLDRQWVEYLMLPEFKRSLETRPADETQQKLIARQVLSRIYSPALKPEQASFIGQVMSPFVIETLKAQASEEVDYEQLLKRLEQYESQPSSFAGHYFNDQYQNLLWSNDPANKPLVSQIETHYRNANVRLSFSERLLNRLIPDLPSTNQPVSEFVNGAKISGRSQIFNQVKVNLLPDPNQAVLQLDTTGYVQSDTIARTKTFRVKNVGEANFQVSKQILFTRNGIDSTAKPYSASSGRQNVVGLSSTLDNVPIFGAVARKLAQKRLIEDGPENDRLFKRKVTSSAEDQVETIVQEKLQQLRQYSYVNLMQPLIAMELEPEPLEFSSTENQLVMRYRLAGRDQMAANTSRPRDSGDSLLSFQIHQSTINNAIARLGLNGNKFTSDELREHLREMMGVTGPVEDQPVSDKEATFEFASHDPIRIDFKDDRMNLVLNLKSLKIGNGKTWKNLILNAAYRVNVNEMKINLTQDEDLTNVRGRRLRLGDKAAVRTVMNVLFKQEYHLNALPKKMYARLKGDYLRISQFVMSDGWIGISIDDRVASVQGSASQEPPKQRLGGFRRILNRR